MSEKKANIWHNAAELAKRYKLLIGVATLLLGLLLISTVMGHKHQQHTIRASEEIGTTHASQASVTKNRMIDMAAGDDAAESLNALTEQLHQVIASNQQLQTNNADLNKKNAKILENIRSEVQQNITTELQKRGQDNQVKIAKLQHALLTVNQELSKVKKVAGEPRLSGGYTINGGQQGAHGQQDFGHRIDVNGQTLVSLPSVPSVPGRIDTSDHHMNSVVEGPHDHTGSILHPNGTINASTQKKSAGIPYYTLPSGATLAGSVTMSALIGRVPVNGVIKSPYPFKMIIGGNNMAANGHHIPGISGAIIQGYTVGDMGLSCVKGYITTITFIFPDGTISTSKVSASSDGSSLGFNNSLGYISEPNGNPCFSGKFYTNAPRYLATVMTLGALNVGGSAYQQAQQTTMTNAVGGTTSSLTGSVGKAMLGGAIQGGTEQVMNWYTQREKNSFDAVYVASGKKAVINLTEQIDINYNPNGRKIYYEHTKNSLRNTSLD